MTVKLPVRYVWTSHWYVYVRGTSVTVNVVVSFASTLVRTCVPTRLQLCVDAESTTSIV